MTNQHIIQTVVEILAIALLLYGYAHEEQIIKFEHSVKRIIVGNYRRFKRLHRR